ncbi:MAG: hypothetical protein A3K60_01055 [Euryarchaeota archaeon RBG_19FT_COMBO_56_21]|nr:MAG: hypothetical protein A3K60_01055 [Euryarchaeota archaeon RBG_19FT_COMBO_56_21]
MEVKELIMSRQELQILTNAIYRGDTRYIHVSYPFYGTELFTLDVGKPELKDIVRPDAFDWARSSKKPLDRSVSADELPSYSDLRNCLLSSGFLSYKNEKEITDRLLALREDSRDPNKRPRPVFVAVDTNILYDRFLSRHLPLTDPTGRSVQAGDFRYVVSEVVLLEIDSRVTHKYSREEIRALAQVFSHPELLQEFSNGSGRRTRVAKLAINEMQYLLTELRALRIKGTPARDKEHNDIEIAQSYKHWARSNDYDVVLLTADEDMVTHARAGELMPLPLEIPFAVPEHARIDPWKMSDLLFDLAVTFGVISLDNEDVRVFGEWGGKSSTDYAREHVKVVFPEQGKHDAVSKQLEVCRRVLGRVNG